MQKQSPGVNLAEYALMGALLTVLGVAGLEMLGGSVSGLFIHSKDRLASANTLSLLEASPSAVNVPHIVGISPSSPSFKGGGYYVVVFDSATGQPMLKIVDGTAGEVKNVSSVDGSQLNTLGTLMLARKLDELASQQTDPELKDYYGQMAKAAYYMGAAEGELDDVGGLHVTTVLNGRKYSNGDALRDLYANQAQLDALMQNPPVSAKAQALAQVMPLTAEVHNIGQNYLNSLKQYISSNGEVTHNFKLETSLRNEPAAGSSVRYAAEMILGNSITGMTYEQYVSYDALKSNVNGVLNSNQEITQPVKTTLNDAVVVDTYRVSK